MPKYLWKFRYTRDGVKGLLEEGGSSRMRMVEKLVSNMGGSLESFYFAFGEDDGYIIADMPSNTDVAAVSMQVAAAGGATIETVALMTPEEADAAVEKSVEYRAPGQ